MNILFTTYQGGLAGATMSITYLAEGLESRGHIVHVACDRSTLLWQNLEQTGVRMHHLSFRGYFDFKAAVEIHRIVVQENIDLINAQGGIDRNLTILSKWIYGLKSKIVFTRRQRPRNEPWIKRWLHTKGSDSIVLVSHGLRDIFLKKGYSDKHLKVIHNGVPQDLIKILHQDEINQLKTHLGLKNKVIGCISRAKIQGEIIASLKYLPLDYQVLFVGINEQDIAPAIQFHQPRQQLIFTGPLPHEEALKYIQLMSVNVLASHMDGFGLVLVEAMLSGVPVIGSDFGGIPDIIQHGHNGFLFQNGNSEQLAEQIQSITNNQQLRGEFIANGKATAQQHFTMERTTSQFEALFKELIAES